jgi:hypothetical protein
MVLFSIFNVMEFSGVTFFQIKQFKSLVELNPYVLPPCANNLGASVILRLLTRKLDGGMQERSTLAGDLLSRDCVNATRSIDGTAMRTFGHIVKEIKAAAFSKGRFHPRTRGGNLTGIAILWLARSSLSSVGRHI